MKLALREYAADDPDAPTYLYMRPQWALICNGGRSVADRNAAVLMAVLHSWYRNDGEPVWRTDEQIVRDSCGLLTENTVTGAKKRLAELGYVRIGRSPKYGWSPTSNYFLDVAAINAALSAAEASGALDRYRQRNRNALDAPQTGASLSRDSPDSYRADDGIADPPMSRHVSGQTPDTYPADDRSGVGPMAPHNKNTYEPTESTPAAPRQEASRCKGQQVSEDSEEFGARAREEKELAGDAAFTRTITNLLSGETTRRRPDE